MSPHALSAAQERRLIDYVDERTLDISRAFKRRTTPSSTMSTLPAYLKAMSALIFDCSMRVPPFVPSGTLRVALMLRLTSDTFDHVTQYSHSPDFTGHSPPSPPPPTNHGSGRNSSPNLNTIDESQSPLDALYSFLHQLDRAWTACISCQAWDHVLKRGLDIELEVDGDLKDPAMQSELPAISGLTPTDEVRLRSLIQNGMSRIEDWLEDASFAEKERFQFIFDQTLRLLNGQ